jgi:primosomal protein N' (replication factor Y)
MSVLRLAIPSPLRQLFDYLPPLGTTREQLAGLQPGMRLRVPFGSREVTGYLVEVRPTREPGTPELRHALEVLDPQSLPGPQMLALCRWAAHYYHHAPGEVYACAFPNRLRKGASLAPAGEPGWRLTTRGRGLPRGALARSPRQSQALAMLQGADAVSTRELSGQGISAAVLRSLEEKGLAERLKIAAPVDKGCSRPGLDLNDGQQQVVQDLLQAREGFSCHLLEGVTGSGKTEVYLRLIADCLERDRQALVLIPEIGLTPQTVHRFQQRFDANIAVLHSGLGAAERCRAWQAARDGSAHIVIGTRSAVFTPLKNPGWIIVDEEHDASYKQQDGFRYSARDVAVKRGQLEHCPVLLGSATPSLETLHNAMAGRYRLHRLSERAGGARMPSLEPLDVRRGALRAGLSDALIEAVESTLAGGGQALLFLNRRGYAPTLRCHDCGWIADCRHCDARLTLHRRRGKLRCHHCGGSASVPARCPACHGPHLLTSGLGTEQAEEFLAQRFNDWPLYRVDSDSVKGRDAMASLVDKINSGQPCILLGTQMLTKGHHFPAVNLVAVLDMDSMLFSTDFRGEERMAQLLTQVAGRAGRADLPGRVLLQTHYPDHPMVRSLIHQPYRQLAQAILARRREAGLPPVGKIVLLRSDCADAKVGENFLHDLRRGVEPSLPRGCSLIGPLPSPMHRRAGMYRCQLLLSAPGFAAAQAAADRLVAGAEALPARRGLKWTIDVDPQDIF